MIGNLINIRVFSEGGSALRYENVENNKELIVCGKLNNTHGYRGAFKLMPLCDDADIIGEIGYLITSDGVERDIESLSYFKDLLIVSLSGITDMEGAERFKGSFVYARREDIPIDEDSYFIADLEGLPVIDADSGVKYGTLISVDNFGASDIYTVRKVGGGEAMIPAVDEFIIRIDIEEGVFVRPIAGMFDEN